MEHHMAERHTIVVRVVDGKVTEVLFCDCCPGISLEVRTYNDSPQASAVARPAWQMGEGMQPSRFLRDEHGVYEAMYYESNGEED
jgi:hypothetical protein